MDLKTLEYMEERAKKAREIVNKIDKLLKNIENIHNVRLVRFLDASYHSEFDTSIGDLTTLVKKSYVEIATQRIQELEKELAEL